MHRCLSLFRFLRFHSYSNFSLFDCVFMHTDCVSIRCVFDGGFWLQQKYQYYSFMNGIVLLHEKSANEYISLTISIAANWKCIKILLWFEVSFKQNWENIFFMHIKFTKTVWLFLKTANSTMLWSVFYNQSKWEINCYVWRKICDTLCVGQSYTLSCIFLSYSSFLCLQFDLCRDYEYQVHTFDIFKWIHGVNIRYWILFI